MASAQCCTPRPDTGHCCCVGKEEPFGPCVSYITSHHTPTAAVVLVSDIFGFESPLLRKFADKTASCGYFVVVPDYFNKDYYVPGDPHNFFADFGNWIKNHQPLDSVESTKAVVEILNKKGFLSVGAVGFCWGAKVVVELAKGSFLKAAVLAHPSFVTMDDIRAVKSPIAILAAEIDQTTPPALSKKFAEILELKTEVQSFAHIYPGVAHGWTIRYDPNDEKAVADAEEAHNKMFEWFGKFLH